jgi:hypothetical protein
MGVTINGYNYDGTAPPPPSGGSPANQPAAPTPAQQIQQLTSEIGRVQSINAPAGSPTAGYLAELNAQLQQLLQQQRAPATNAQQPQSMFRPGSPTPMQKDSNRSLRSVADNGAARPVAPMPGLARAAAQATNVKAGKTPSGGAVQAPTIEGPSQKSLYSFVPSAETGQNPTGLDQNYLKFLQSVFTQNMQAGAQPSGAIGGAGK